MRVKAPLLASAMLTIMAGAAVAPALGRIRAAFPDVEITFIKLILTIPALFTIIATFFIVGYFTARFGKRRVLLVGILGYIVAGVAGGFMNNIWSILATRAVLGVSVGIIMPLTNGMIADFFSGAERASMMGKSSAFANLGGIVATILSGALALVSWRLAFSIYGAGIISLGLVALYLPEPEVKASGRRLPIGLPPGPWVVGGVLFIMMTMFYSIPTGLAIFIETQNIGGAGLAGLCLSIMTATAFFAGLFLGRLRELTGRGLLPVLLGLMTGGFFLFSAAHEPVMVFAAAVIFGYGFGSLVPVLYVAITEKVEPSRNVEAMSLATGFLFLGQFMSPPILDALSTWFGDGSTGFTYAMNGTILLVPFIIVTVCSIRSLSLKGDKVCGIPCI